MLRNLLTRIGPICRRSKPQGAFLEMPRVFRLFAPHIPLLEGTPAAKSLTRIRRWLATIREKSTTLESDQTTLSEQAGRFRLKTKERNL